MIRYRSRSKRRRGVGVVIVRVAVAAHTAEAAGVAPIRRTLPPPVRISVLVGLDTIAAVLKVLKLEATVRVLLGPVMLAEDLHLGKEPELVLLFAELAGLDSRDELVRKQRDNFLVEVATHIAGEPATLVGPDLIHVVVAEQILQPDNAVVHDDEHDLAAVLESLDDFIADLERTRIRPIEGAGLFRCDSCHNKNLLKNIFAYKSVLLLKSLLVVHTSEQYIGVNQ